jgi:hypothetical protein
MIRSCDLFIVELVGSRLVDDFGRTDLLTRHSILFAGPFIEINQLTSLRTEWPPRIALPLDLLSARWTFLHNKKVERKPTKVKATGGGSSPTVRPRAVSFPNSDALSGVE